MYKVLLVDDERIITEGIAKVIDWESIGTKLIATARNGIEALDLIEKEMPDIIVSDIKMPGMNGLQLVEKVHYEYPEVRFVLLTGFSEFDFAKRAMSYGVRHYLLKPCNEQSIIDAVKELCEELTQQRNRNEFIQSMKKSLEDVLPYAKEQLLKELITNHYENGNIEYFQKLFQIDLHSANVRIVLFQLEGEFEFEHIFAMKNIAEQIFESYILSFTVGDKVIFLLKDNREINSFQSKITIIKDTFFQYYLLDSTVTISGSGKISQANKLYKEALDCLSYRFYLGEGGVITKGDIINHHDPSEEVFYYDDQTFCRLVKSGSLESVKKELHTFFGRLLYLKHDINMTRSYVIQLYNAMIRLCGMKEMNKYLCKLTNLLEMDTIQQMHTYFETIAGEITRSFYQKNKNKHSAIVNKVIEIIDKHIGNQNMSLHWVANEMLYMNADYLGKLFKKETGEKFSHYITKKRIEMAKQLIERENDVKVFEIADKIGYGDNPQYFSQVFKKHTGFTPSEYKRESLL